MTAYSNLFPSSLLLENTADKFEFPAKDITGGVAVNGGSAADLLVGGDDPEVSPLSKDCRNEEDWGIDGCTVP